MKRVLAAFLSALLILPVFSGIISLADNEYILFDLSDAAASQVISPASRLMNTGDVNTDGKTNSKDVAHLKKILAGTVSVFNRTQADVNGDGSVNTRDYTLLKRVLNGQMSLEPRAVPTCSVNYDAEYGAARVTSELDGASFSVSPGGEVSGQYFNYAVIFCEYNGAFDAAANVSLPGAAERQITLAADGETHALTVDLSSDNPGSADALTVATDLPAGNCLHVTAIAFAKSESAAQSAAAGGGAEPTEDPMAKIIFDSQETTLLINGANNTSVSYSGEQNAAALTVTGNAGDPQSVISYEGSSLSADEYKYITLVYMVPSGTSAKASKSEFFLCSGSVTQPVAECNAVFEPVKDGVYHSAVISLATASFWTGDVRLIRLDYYSECLAGDTMFIDSISLSKTRADASATGFERLALRGNGGGAVSAPASLNGVTSSVKYFGSSSVSGNGTCTFSGAVTAVVDGSHRQFNRFTVEYSSNAIIRGKAYYVSGGAEREDEFFLENTGGETKVFRSLILGYFDGEYADSLKLIEFSTINTSSASFAISSVSEDTFEEYDQATYFLSNSEFKLGIDLCMGGGVNYLEAFDDNNPAYTNLLNNYDVGRLIQQSYYGIDRAPYPLGYWGGHSWGYNPVQGGDKVNSISRVIDFEFRGDDSFYVKARPMDWGQVNMQTPSYMENVYTLTDSYVYVYNRFVDFSGYTHTSGWQELPAFYTISALNNFYYYNGSSPWTGDALIKRSDLVFWGAVSNQAFDLKSTSEFWSAWCDNAGFGVGLYVPGVYTYHAGKFEYNGTADPSANPTNYVAPRRYITLVCGKPLEYSYLITAGNLGDIRNTFKDNRSLINNYSLEHYN